MFVETKIVFNNLKADAMLSDLSSYILRVQKDELERQLFGRHAFYVNISRNWSRGTIVLFIKKDAFISSGIVDMLVGTDAMEEWEKKLCIENNWYGKVLFARLARFVPAVPLRDTPAAGQNPLALHGASMSSEDAATIERMAARRIIS
jgi:hypothetical protein